MTETEYIAAHLNTLGRFLGRRDLTDLTAQCLKEYSGLEQVDVFVLFGGSILEGGDVLARAMNEGIARKYVIVGGEGHTTETLRRTVHEMYPRIETTGLPEAEVFSRYLQHVHGKRADYLETQSTNCGNNISYLLRLLEENGVSCNSAILCQDASMQLRMDAGMRKYAPDCRIINYAAYRAEVLTSEGKIVFGREIRGMWSMERYVNLLMGEIPRLRDDENGYGPRGKGFIAHVDIPEEVLHAFEELKHVFGSETRSANPLYASVRQ